MIVVQVCEEGNTESVPRLLEISAMNFFRGYAIFTKKLRFWGQIETKRYFLFWSSIFEQAGSFIGSPNSQIPTGPGRQASAANKVSLSTLLVSHHKRGFTASSPLCGRNAMSRQW